MVCHDVLLHYGIHLEVDNASGSVREPVVECAVMDVASEIIQIARNVNPVSGPMLALATDNVNFASTGVSHRLNIYI